MNAVHYKDGCSALDLIVVEQPVPHLRDREILLKVFATAVNRADIIQRRGFYPPPAGESNILGLEAAGKVHSIGPNCSNKWKIGDRVMALLPGGGNAEYAAVHEDLVMAVPSKLTLTQAAAIPEVWLTAYQLLHFVGYFKTGQSVLIHAGGSGVGTAAVQLVALLNGTSYVTAGSQAKIDFAKSLGAKDGFNYKSDNFSEKILAATGGRGVDLILDCVGASMWEQNAASVCVDGTWVLYGSLGGNSLNGDILANILRKRITLKGTTIRTRSIPYKAEVISSFSNNILPHFSKGDIRPIIYKVLQGLDNVGTAHAIVESNENTGKVVIQMEEETTHPHGEL